MQKAETLISPPYFMNWILNKTKTIAAANSITKEEKPMLNNFWIKVHETFLGISEITIFFFLKKPNNKRKDKIRSEEHTSELQSRQYLVCRLLLEKKTLTPFAIYVT